MAPRGPGRSCPAPAFPEGFRGSSSRNAGDGDALVDPDERDAQSPFVRAGVVAPVRPMSAMVVVGPIVKVRFLFDAAFIVPSDSRFQGR